MSPHTKTSWSTIVIAAVLIVIAAGMIIPAIPLASDGARRKANLSSNMRQVLLGMISYASEPDRPGQTPVWPHDDRMLIAWSDGELTEKLYRDTRHPDVQPAWIYIRPTTTAPASQPVLVSDPRCTDGRGCLVTYADGHVGTVKNPAIWTEARRLATLPKAAAEGIDRSDWTTWIERP